MEQDVDQCGIGIELVPYALQATFNTIFVVGHVRPGFPADVHGSSLMPVFFVFRRYFEARLRQPQMMPSISPAWKAAFSKSI